MELGFVPQIEAFGLFPESLLSLAPRFRLGLGFFRLGQRYGFQLAKFGHIEFYISRQELRKLFSGVRIHNNSMRPFQPGAWDRFQRTMDKIVPPKKSKPKPAESRKRPD